ncbi:hypothetical protein [Massilia soli]|uniref:Uncharacterized protein n=1 Tax=Massilia soli TaxID=2792854 RepID=A0ABS7SLS4_9BURK|nr:hypothetical protein [Massilia soli]MBZ2207129.1 hypothetical protein [Massilia soli]
MDVRKLAEQFAADKNKADTLNANIGYNGTNPTYDKAQGNNGKLMNPNGHPNHRAPGAPDDEEAEGDVFGPAGSAD